MGKPLRGAAWVIYRDLIERAEEMTPHCGCVEDEALKMACSRIDALRAENERLTGVIASHNNRMSAMPNCEKPPSLSAGLRLLAQWFCALYQEVPSDDEAEVQRDLLRWADEHEVLRTRAAEQDAELARLCAENERLQSERDAALKERDAAREIFVAGTTTIDYDRWVACVDERDCLKTRVAELEGTEVSEEGDEQNG